MRNNSNFKLAYRTQYLTSEWTKISLIYPVYNIYICTRGKQCTVLYSGLLYTVQYWVPNNNNRKNRGSREGEGGYC